MNHNIAIGSNIRELRKHTGLSQEALAKYLSVTREIISCFENGTRRITVEELLKLCKKLS